jgi:hypothetical protein
MELGFNTILDGNKYSEHKLFFLFLQKCEEILSEM